jgi:drug/metabolite transporter (DMT)-like permease
MRNFRSVQISGKNGDTGEVAGALPAPAIAAPPVSRPFRGMLLLLSALFFFTCMDTTTKFLAANYPVPLVVAIRYIVNCALMMVILAPRQGMQLVQTRRTGLVLIRAVSLVLASLFVGLGLQRMPVAETTAIVFLGPMLVVLLARPLLGERIGAPGWTAAVIGFAGVLLIARPGSGLAPAGVIYGLCAAGANAAYQLLSRVLARTERTIALLFYTTLVGSICFGISLPWFWEGKAPTLWQLLLFSSMGVTGGIGHYLFTAAFRHAPASLLAPINYVQLLWAGLLGWIVFGHLPDSLTILGMAVVAASGVMIAFKSRQPAS